MYLWLVSKYGILINIGALLQHAHIVDRLQSTNIMVERSAYFLSFNNSLTTYVSEEHVHRTCCGSQRARCVCQIFNLHQREDRVKPQSDKDVPVGFMGTRSKAMRCYINEPVTQRRPAAIVWSPSCLSRVESNDWSLPRWGFRLKYRTMICS
jgi:hypothetical protein